MAPGPCAFQGSYVVKQPAFSMFNDSCNTTSLQTNHQKFVSPIKTVGLNYSHNFFFYFSMTKNREEGMCMTQFVT